jgi:formylglycine-generating enzyme required for sulfatase activity
LAAAALLSPLTLAQAPLSEMVVIPAGPFTMGSNEGPEDERPAHEVTLPLFTIERFPVTNAQFAAILDLQLAQAGPVARLYDVDDPDARIIAGRPLAG